MRRLGVSWVGAFLLLAFQSGAQAPPSAASPQASAASPAPGQDLDVAPDSPRAALNDFFALANRGRYEEAAAYLDLTPEQQPSGAELARKLKTVLDRYLWVDLEAVSAASQGDDKDSQPALVDQLGVIPVEDRKEPVRIVKRNSAAGMRWMFSRNTVSRIDSWYAQLDDLWIRGHMPQLLLRFGPQKLLLWQWLALPIVAALSWYGGRLLSWLARRLARPITSRAGAWGGIL